MTKSFEETKEEQRDKEIGVYEKAAKTSGKKRMKERREEQFNRKFYLIYKINYKRKFNLRNEL